MASSLRNKLMTLGKFNAKIKTKGQRGLHTAGASPELILANFKSVISTSTAEFSNVDKMLPNAYLTPHSSVKWTQSGTYTGSGKDGKVTRPDIWGWWNEVLKTDMIELYHLAYQKGIWRIIGGTIITCKKQ